jgi:Protein of unknown function (DUF3224)
MTSLVAVLYLALSAGASLHPHQKGLIVTNHAKGTFDVKVTPQAQDDAAGGPFGRLFLDKQFHGDLDGTSKGQMLAWGTGTDGSGAYVALELVSGTLNGRRGTFVLQHTGSMTKNVATMIVTVVPDSGTGELTGLAGKMTIVIAGGKHSYELEYTL